MLLVLSLLNRLAHSEIKAIGSDQTERMLNRPTITLMNAMWNEDRRLPDARTAFQYVGCNLL